MTEPRVQRRLAAVLAADVVGYSGLMEQDEAGTLATLKARRHGILNPLVAQHQGRVVKVMGDGVLVEFASAVDAVECAVQLQQGFEQANQSILDANRIVLRIGINLGDILVEGSDIYGDGVNIAARLESLAEPGGIYVSATVHDHVIGKLALSFDDLGERTLKNIAKPVRVYRAGAGGNSNPTALPLGSTKEKPSVAVLPFVNMSGDPEQEYFSDGITEDITTALTMWRSFPVISRNSSFAYRHDTEDMRTIGRELGANYILHGSVRRDSIRVKVNAHLIDSVSGHHVWTKVFDERIDDIFMLQEELARLVAANLVPALAKVELAHVKAKRPSNLSAWECCLRGRARLSDYSREANIEARVLLEAAIGRDPDYSDAFGYLALSYSRDLLLECYDDRAKTMVALHDAARRAVALNDESPLAHYLLSTSHVWRDELDLSVAEGRLAVALNPYDAEILHALGNKLDLIGDPEGITFMEQALRLNPRDPERQMYLTFLARAYLNIGDFDRSIACAQNAVHWKPDYPHAYFVLGLALGLQGQCKDAKDALNTCQNLHHGFIEKRENWHPYLDESRNRRLLEGLKLAGWTDWPASGNHAPETYT